MLFCLREKKCRQKINELSFFFFLFQHFEEVPADGLYCVDFVSNRNDQGCESPFRINKFEWKIASEELQSSLFLSCPVQTPFNRQMPTERDTQVIEENRRSLSPQENTHDENALKLEESVGSESAVKGASEKRDVEIAMSNLDTVENENIIEPTISGRDETSLNCDSEFSGCEKSLEARVCGLHLNTNFSSRNQTLQVSTAENFEARATESFNSNSSPMHSDASGLSRHFCLETSCNELTKTNELGEDTNLSSTRTAAEGCSRCNLVRIQWNSSYRESRHKFITVLGDAVRKRVWNLPRTCSNSVLSTSEANSSASSERQHKDARVGILFSGGIDSMMIAALADR